ncbi:uncharacterized protein BcabD6B2_41370 [Babesia caballi]|uniref:Uncharacterized protein n=1 Tax=Babesia caballi TaxID=5871 RepID=A0AAV4LWW8_BABCB|nr:hypothetical protein BcabD6B2_41370 [Babesia caballi]
MPAVEALGDAHGLDVAVEAEHLVKVLLRGLEREVLDDYLGGGPEQLARGDLGRRLVGALGYGHFHHLAVDQQAGLGADGRLGVGEAVELDEAEPPGESGVVLEHHLAGHVALAGPEVVLQRVVSGLEVQVLEVDADVGRRSGPVEVVLRWRLMFSLTRRSTVSRFCVRVVAVCGLPGGQLGDGSPLVEQFHRGPLEVEREAEVRLVSQVFEGRPRRLGFQELDYAHHRVRGDGEAQQLAVPGEHLHEVGLSRVARQVLDDHGVFGPRHMLNRVLLGGLLIGLIRFGALRDLELLVVDALLVEPLCELVQHQRFRERHVNRGELFVRNVLFGELQLPCHGRQRGVDVDVESVPDVGVLGLGQLLFLQLAFVRGALAVSARDAPVQFVVGDCVAGVAVGLGLGQVDVHDAAAEDAPVFGVAELDGVGGEDPGDVAVALGELVPTGGVVGRRVERQVDVRDGPEGSAQFPYCGLRHVVGEVEYDHPVQAVHVPWIGGVAFGFAGVVGALPCGSCGGRLVFKHRMLSLPGNPGLGVLFHLLDQRGGDLTVASFSLGLGD